MVLSDVHDFCGATDDQIDPGRTSQAVADGTDVVNDLAGASGRSDRGLPNDDASTLVAAMPGAVLVMADRRIVFANPAALDLFGVDALETLVEREAARAHVLSEDRDRIDARLDAIERGQRVPTSAEYRILRPDGSVRVVEWSTLPIVFAGQPALMCAVDDVTALAMTRDALRASEQHQREVIATLAEGVIVVDRYGFCSDANPAAARMLGLREPEQLVGSNADDMPLVDAEGAPVTHAQHPVWRALDDGEHIRNEVCLIRFPDRTRRMRVSTIPIVAAAAVGVTAGVGAVVTFDDVTVQIEEQERTAASEARFRKLAAIAPIIVFETDRNGLCTSFNGRWSAVTGLGREAIGTHWTAAVGADDVVAVTAAWSRSVRDSIPFKSQFSLRHPDGTDTFVSCEATPITDADDAVTGWIGTATDLSAELTLRQELRASEARFRTLVEQSPDATVRILLRPWRIGYLSPSIVGITGWTRDEFYADPTLMATNIHPDDLDRVARHFDATTRAERFEYRLIHRDGSIRTIEVHSNVVDTATGPTAVEATMRDITQQVAEHDTLTKLAHQDELTGLSNRRAIMSTLETRLAGREPTSVIFLDLDQFKLVNDSHGHDAGDEVLRTVARRLATELRGNDQVGRLGGDEFVVISRPDVARLLARRLADQIEKPILLARGTFVTVGASVGINDFDPNGPVRTAADLLRHADRAMYIQKHHRADS